MTVKLKILFIGDFRWNSGSSHVIAEYVRVSELFGAEVRVSASIGSHDRQIEQYLRYEDNLGWANRVVIVLEGNPFLNVEQIDKLNQYVPWEQRLVIDADGHLLAPTFVGGDDNLRPVDVATWRHQFELAGGLVVQPACPVGTSIVGEPPFSYFGMPELHRPAMVVGASHCGLRYVGANWWRFRPFVEVATAYRSEADPESRIEVCGRWWNGEIRNGHEKATESDLELLRVLRTAIRPPVPFGGVVRAMSESTITPILVRPVLAELGLITPRMFESLSAFTIPVYRWQDRYISGLLGDGQRFCLEMRMSHTIALILSNLERYTKEADEVRHQLFGRYRYEAVFARLVALLS